MDRSDNSEKETIDRLLKFVQSHINQGQNDRALKLLETIRKKDTSKM